MLCSVSSAGRCAPVTDLLIFIFALARAAPRTNHGRRRGERASTGCGMVPRGSERVEVQ
jgi:hypothetical protein